MTDTKSATDRPIMFGTPVEEAMTELAAILDRYPADLLPTVEAELAAYYAKRFQKSFDEALAIRRREREARSQKQ